MSLHLTKPLVTHLAFARSAPNVFAGEANVRHTVGGGMSRHDAESLGEPSLSLNMFQLWVHGYQYRDSTDYWDGNWLRVTAHCRELDASVWASGSFLRNTDLLAWAERCEALHDGRAEVAVLDPLEPELKVEIRRSDSLGHLTVVVEITPDHLAQWHRFETELDQTYLPRISRMCRDTVESFPVRGEPER